MERFGLIGLHVLIDFSVISRPRVHGCYSQCFGCVSPITKAYDNAHKHCPQIHGNFGPLCWTPTTSMEFLLSHFDVSTP